MAAPAKTTKTTIEFIPQEDWEKTSFGKFLKWLLSIGRWIVIITELIVIIAFLSRFKLDRDLTNLNEIVKQKQAIISASSSFEKEFRFLQKKLATIEGLGKLQIKSDQVLSIFSQITPAGIELSNFTIDDQKKISLKVSADSESTFAFFIKKLKAETKLKNLAIDKISINEEQSGKIVFNVKTELNE